jgi:hypothetical protein
VSISEPVDAAACERSSAYARSAFVRRAEMIMPIACWIVARTAKAPVRPVMS